MPFSTDTLGLPDDAFGLLRDLIHERTGLYFGKGRNDVLTDKLSPLVIERGFNSFLDYYYLLKYDPEAENEWRRVVDALSVQETYFWREIDQILTVVEVLVPQYFSRPRGQTLRIWSAACATGEEPLTLAMALSESGWLERVPIEIYASDASAAAIEGARRGLYRERSLHHLQPALREKYFVPENGRWRIQPQLRSRIRWSVANLVLESDVSQLATASIILCRNVFIYFSPESIIRTLKMFSRLMPTPGHLFVGASESLLKLTTDFDFQEIGGAFVYVKT